MRRINDLAAEKIKQWEGLVLYAYDDADKSRPPRRIQPGDKVKGVLTIGYGHTGTDVKPGMKITRQQADELFRQDIAVAENIVASAVNVPLNDNQFGALVSFAFNVGGGAFRSSTLLRKLNAGDYASVPTELARWNKTTIAGKKVQSEGLVNRRAAEIGLWATGSHVASNTIEVKPASAEILTKENVGFGVGTLATLLGSITSHGPVAWALAGVLVVAFGFGLWWFFIRQEDERP